MSRSYNRTPLTIVKLVLDNETVYFSDGNTPPGVQAYPVIKSINVTPVKLSEDRGFALSGSVTVSLTDFDLEQGSFLARLLGRNRYWLDREMTIYQGFPGAGVIDWADFTARTYFIEKFDPPNDKGMVTVQGRDVSKKLDGNRAKIPTANEQSVLVSGITAATTGLVDVTDVTGYPSSGWLRINDEIIEYDSISSTSVNITARGEFGTTAAAHSANDSCQWCYGFESENVVDVIRDIIDNYSPIGSGYIDDTEWDAERDDFFGSDTITGCFSEPETIKDVIRLLCQQVYADVWWDDQTQKLKIAEVGSNFVTLQSINSDDHILDSGHSVVHDIKKLATEVWIFFGAINHTLDLKEFSNYSELKVKADSAAATNWGTDAVKQIYAPHIGSSTAIRLADRLLASLNEGVRRVKWELDQGDASFETGDSLYVKSDLVQNSDGEPMSLRCRIVSRKDLSADRVAYEAVATSLTEPGRYCLIAPAAQVDYASASQAEKDKYGFISDAAEEMSDSSEAYAVG